MLGRCIKSLLLSLIVLLMVSGVALSAWEYLFPVKIVDTSNTTRVYYPVLLGFSGQSLVDASKISVNGTDTNMQIGSTDIHYMMSTTNVTAVVPNLSSGGLTIVDVYTRYSPEQSGFSIIPGSGGSVTVVDSPNLELGNNFTIEQSGWINTDNGTSKNLVSKSGAFRTTVSSNVSGNITATIYAGGVSYNSTPVVAMLSQNDLAYGGGGWLAANLTDSNIATRAFDTDTADAGAWMMIDYGVNNEQALTGWRYYVDGAVTAIWDIQYSSDNSSWTTAYVGLDCAGGAGWKVANWTSVGSYRYWRSRKTNAVGAGSYHTELDTVSSGGISVTATNVTTAERSIVTRANSALLELLVDDENILWNSNFEIGDPPTGWYVTGAGATANRSTTQVVIGTYSANLTAPAAVATRLNQDVANYTDYQGENVTFGAWTYATVANRVSLWVADDGSNSISGNHSGVAGWEWLSVTHPVDIATTNLTAMFRISSGATTMAYIDGARMVEGNSVSQPPPIPVTAALSGASVPNNSSNWTFMTGNSMPYTDNITLSVNNTQQMYLSPLVMITGATIPDRSGDATSNPGTIIWGSNSGINIIYGEMESYESTELVATSVGGFTMPQASMPSTWFAAGENVASLPFYDSFILVANDIGVPVQVFYFWAIMGVAFGIFISIVVLTRSALLAYIAMVIVFGIGSSMTIIPAWIVFVMIITGGGIMFLYRQVAY